ncbi:MAG TPA: NnrS family protein [Porticoccus sp.]|nr:NnrS family protein [Porticoccus sp.]
MLNITDMKKEQKKTPIFRLAFRPFFLFGSLFSVIALLLWATFLNSSALPWQPHGSWIWWHGHEMLFGFSTAIIVGFLLTAIQNWSGMPGLSGWPLAGLFGLWVLGRLLMLFPIVPSSLIAIVDTLFLPLAAYVLARPVVAAKLWRNLMFIPLLLLLTWTNGHSHYRLISGDLLSLPDTQATILIITLIIVIMGGRVIPFFTANANRTQKTQPLMFLELLSIVPLGVITIYSLITGNLSSEPVIGILFLVAALANLFRMGRWQSKLTLGTPLLWSLHLSYLLIVISLALLGAFHFGLAISLSTALHGLTIGGIGLMILAMISRVSLGHTGRMLQVGAWITLGYGVLALSAILRVIAPLFSGHSPLLYLISISCWVLGYMAFVIVYWPVLTQPRIDGRPG